MAEIGAFFYCVYEMRNNCNRAIQSMSLKKKQVSVDVNAQNM